MLTDLSCSALSYSALSLIVPFLGVKQEQLSPRSQQNQPENLVMQTAHESSIFRGTSQGGSLTKGMPSNRAPSDPQITYRGSITHVGLAACGLSPIPTQHGVFHSSLLSIGSSTHPYSA
ncbi:hypothetical protein FKM82_026994 [Ascaphus truei]